MNLDYYPTFLMTGFIPGSRASFVMDFVAVALLAILVALTYSIYLVAIRKNYLVHKYLQSSLALILFVAVLIFEIDIRILGWESRAEVSPFYEDWVYPTLYVHLAFAITTFVLWLVVTVQALRKFPSHLKYSPYNQSHKKLAKPAALSLYGTALTGWVFYYIAFLA